MKSIVPTLLTVLCAFALLTGCGPQESKQPPDKVTIQLKWVHQAQFAGYYVAKEQGYYAEEDLDVTFSEGGPGIAPEDRVASGQADFAVTAAEDVIVKRSQGEPLVAIAVIYRRNPLAFITLRDSGIETPADFPGHTLAVQGTSGEMQMRAMLKKLSLDANQVQIVPYKYDYSSLYSGEDDITVGYSTGGLIRMQEARHEVNLIWPSDYAVHVYADTLISRDELIAADPDLVTRFLRATLKGWRQAIDDTDMAVTSTLKYAREADRALQTEMMDTSLPLIHTGEDQIGWMRADIWQGMYNMLLDQGSLEQPVVVAEVFTMQFLNTVYGDHQ